MIRIYTGFCFVCPAFFYFFQNVLWWVQRVSRLFTGKGDDAIVYLHYFFGGCDWYITEKDVDGGVQQAFGYAVLFGDKQNAELGYICITEITQFGAELDLYFTPCPLAEIKLIKIAA